MKTIRFERFGNPSQVATCVEVAEPPAPAAWEVLVEVLAFSINPSDVAILAGQYGNLPPLPATPGMEAVGRIRACGSAVRELAVGDVVLLVANGCWTQRCKLPATAVHKVPPGLDLKQLAVLKVNAATAWLLLTGTVPLKRGDWVLQSAPLSSVGRAVIQLCRHLGLRTVNVVRRDTAIDEVRAAGGDVAVLDAPDLAARVAQATRKASIKLALDAVGGPGIERLADGLGRGASVINYGMLSRQAAVLRPDQMIFRGIQLQGFWLSDRLGKMPLKERDQLFTTLVELLAKGVLDARIAPGEWDIGEIGAAIRDAEPGVSRGKVLVYPNGLAALGR